MSLSLRLEGVSKRFADHLAVDRLDLEIPSGIVVGFLGPNGAGKTTTIRMIMSIYTPDSGTLSVLGEPNALLVKDRLGYLPEEKGLYRKMRAVEVVAYFGRLKGMTAPAAKAAAKALLERLELGHVLEKKCEALSKGMQQKVQVAATLVHDPEFVILDEPFSGLDPVNAELLRGVIRDLKAKRKTVMFSTHVMEHAEQLCDHVVLINRGKKVLDGSLASVRQSRGLSVHLDYDGDSRVLQGLPGVARLNDAGKTAELALLDGADPQAILSALVGRIAIRKFDLREPSLHEIFVREVGGKTHE